MSREPIVTGIGILSPWGEGWEVFREGLAAGCSALGPVERFDARPFGVDQAGEIRGFDPLRYLPAKGLRGIERPSLLLLAAAVLALRHAGPELDEASRERTGVVVGTAFSTASDLSRYDQELLAEGPLVLNPGDWPKISPSSPSSRLSIHFGLRGPSLTLGGEGAGREALSEAMSLIRAGAVDRALVGAVDELSPERLGRRRALGETAAPGEAAVVLVVEPPASGRVGRLLPKGRLVGTAFRRSFEELAGDWGAAAGLLEAVWEPTIREWACEGS